jgi:hypothetical protein
MVARILQPVISWPAAPLWWASSTSGSTLPPGALPPPQNLIAPLTQPLRFVFAIPNHGVLLESAGCLSPCPFLAFSRKVLPIGALTYSIRHLMRLIAPVEYFTSRLYFSECRTAKSD